MHGPWRMAFQCHFPLLLGVYLILLHGFGPHSLSSSLFRNHTCHHRKHFSQLFYLTNSFSHTQFKYHFHWVHPVGAPTTRWIGLQGLALVMLT